MTKRKAVRVAGLSLGLVIMGVALFFLVQIGPRNLWGMLLYDQREEGTLAVGDPAPDVAVVALDGTRAQVREWTGSQPVVLIFGSHT
jgi:hypothetical protein